MSNKNDRLVQFREFLHLNQTTIADRIGIHRRNWSRYENGDVSVPDSVLIKLSELGLNIHWLVTGEGDMLTHSSLPHKSIDLQKNTENANISLSEQLDNPSLQDMDFNFADEIRQTRKKMGKTQKEIAELLGIPQTTWSNYEIGKAKPPLKILMQLADLGYPLQNISGNIMLGSNITQNIGHNSKVITSTLNESTEKRQNYDDNDMELFHLIHNYAPLKMKEEIKAKLLKIKELADSSII